MTIQKITTDSPESKSPDLVADNIAKLKELFPELVTEGKEGVSVNMDVLKQLVGDKILTDSEEKYGLNWHGKRKARQLALTPSTGTLRPCPQDSVDWDSTKNIMIEGENLEVLKLLRKAYSGAVRLIYIDPPYNTSGDFIYPDSFQDNLDQYLKDTGQIDSESRAVTTNLESSGRFHTSWLNMILPRIKVAHGLLKKEGCIVISIDDGELSRLREVCDEVFGPENFVANLVWRSRTSISDDHAISMNHNHTLIYAKNKEYLKFYGEKLDESEYENRDGDERGPWKLVPIDANKPGGDTNYPIKNPNTGEDFWPPEGRSWAINRGEFDRLLQDGRIAFGLGGDSAPKRKLFLNERLAKGDTKTPSSVLLDAGTTKDGSGEVAKLFGKKKIFSYPKPTSLLQRIIQYALYLDDGETVLDFFAGSGTTGHACMLAAQAEKLERRFILVQYPEPLSKTEAAQKPAAEMCDKLGVPRNIAELTKERLRRAINEIKSSDPDYCGDLGFRVFKLDSTNIREWEPKRISIGEELENVIDHLKVDRTEQDILFELLLKLGLDLCVPIEVRKIAGKDVHSIAAGTLIVCLTEALSREEIEPLALGIAKWREELAPAGETQCVFRDKAFADDVAKTNLTAILEQHGLKTVRSL